MSESGAAARFDYPQVESDDIVEELHGHRVSDPYRHLEDPDAPRTVAFVAAQNALSEPYLAGLAQRPAFLERTTALLTAPKAGTPWSRGGRYLMTANPGELDQDRILVADTLGELLAGGRVLLDPNTLSADGTVALGAVRVSPDGRYAAYTVAEAGSDWITIRVRDIDTGQDLPDTAGWCKWVSPTWMPDSRSFLYWQYPAPEVGGEFTAAMGAGELKLHRLGDDADRDILIWSRPEELEWMPDPWVSPDGRYLVLTVSPGTDSRTTVWMMSIAQDERGDAVPVGATVSVIGDLTDAHHVVTVDGDRLILHTEAGADRGRLITLDLTDPDGGVVEIVSEREFEVLDSATRVGAAIAVVWSRDLSHRIEVFDLDGTSLGVTAAPGSVTAVNGETSREEFFVGTTSFTSRLRRFRAVGAVLTELAAVDGEPSLPPATVRRVRAISTDGTPVPMTLVRRSDLPDGPRPTLLYGYGGFDISLTPSFSSLFAAWVAAGGVLAVANLRGGGEFGTVWHQQGMLVHKQQVFDDAIACAEHLIASGVTGVEELAVHGRSNGGLLVGALLTQRPDLFAAALPSVGVLDMLRFHRFTIGWAWTTEYGSPDDPEAFEYLSAYSPLHRLTDGVAYPATLICTGDHDDRVVPAHSLKFGARLQEVQGGAAPVLLRVDTRAGHGAGKPARALAAEYADVLAFAAEHTGLDGTR